MSVRVIICLAACLISQMDAYCLHSPDTYTHLDSVGISRECQLCPPGMKMTGGCTATNSFDHCQPCPLGSFSECYDRATSCAWCKIRCDNPSETMKRTCRATRDNECACNPGYYRSKDDGYCYPHAMCPIGYGVVEKGTESRNTKCAPCVSGKTYSDVSSPTETCRECFIPPCNQTHSSVSNCTANANNACNNRSNITLVDPTGPEWYIYLLIAVGALAILLVACFIYKIRTRRTDGDMQGAGPLQEALLLTRQQTRCKMFDLIARKIRVNDWKSFARRLPGIALADAELERIERDIRGVVDQIYRALSQHAITNPSIELVTYVETLKMCGHNDLAEEAIDLLQESTSCSDQNGNNFTPSRPV